MIPDAEIHAAQIALANNDDAKAKAIFLKMSQFADIVDKSVAVADFNLGKIAEEDINYNAAYRYFTKAVRRADDNPEYLYLADQIAQTIALYVEAITYFRAIPVLLKANMIKP